ncbi:MAG: nucleoside recognition domain-containing protein, partial [Thermacetogeniaceae bacterium]
PLTKRSIALLLLQGDREIEELVENSDPANYPKIKEVIAEAQRAAGTPLALLIGRQRQEKVSAICLETVTENPRGITNWGELLSRLTLNPITGIPILILVLYFGLYRFVGGFGGGTLVNWLETAYEKAITPHINAWAEHHIPLPALQSLLAGDYGILTLALRYAIAIVLPIVGAFFLFFAVIEDSGYLPRLAALVDRLFKFLGLSGRAVIPLALGFGCDTMATMVTRTLETTKERVISTLLLALAVPCSAQLGVILGILSSRPKAMAIWLSFILLVFLLVGFLSARLLPGEGPSFFMELPPMRLPRLRNVLAKTYTRMLWYFLEVLPLFVLASVLIWIGELSGAFDLLLKALAPVMGLLGLPPETAYVFLFGFFRRDYGAAGLFDLYHRGSLTGIQLVVAAVTLTLFVPCIAQFIMMVKERGAKTALAIAAFTLLAALCSGFTLFHLLSLLGVSP